MQSIDEDKIILYDEDLPKDSLMMTWGMSSEIWLLSTIENNYTQSIIAIRNKEQFVNDLKKPKVFLSMWNKTMYQNLNPKYFIFKDTASTYKHKELQDLIELKVVE